MDVRKLSNIDFDALVSTEKIHRMIQSLSSSPLISQSEVLVDEFAPLHKLGTILRQSLIVMKPLSQVNAFLSNARKLLSVI